MSKEKDEGTEPEIQVDDPQKTQHEIELEKEIETVKAGAEAEIKGLKKINKDLKADAEKNAKPDVPEPTPAPAQPIQVVEPDSVMKVVEEALAKIDTSRLEELKKSTLGKFIKEHNEFEESNDPGGLRLDAFKRKLSTMVTQGLSTEEELYSRFEDAYRLLGSKDTELKTPGDVSPPTPTNSKEPVSVDTSKLTAEDKKLAKAANMTEEQYAEKMDLHGDMINSLKRIGDMTG